MQAEKEKFHRKIAERQKILETSYSRQRFRKNYKDSGSSDEEDKKKKMQVPAGFGLEDSRSVSDAIRIGKSKESGKGKEKALVKDKVKDDAKELSLIHI